MASSKTRKARILLLQQRVTLTGTGEGVFISNRATLDSGYAKLIEVGNWVVVTTGCVLLCHDASLNNKDGVMRYGKIILEDHVSVGANAVILPGVRVGRGSIIGAGSVVAPQTDIPPNEIWGGVPARKIGDYQSLSDRAAAMRELTPEEYAKVREGDGSMLEPLELVTVTGTKIYEP